VDLDLSGLSESSPDFVPTMLAVFGERGRVWLERLPIIVQSCAERWNLRVSAPFPNLTYNFVAPAESRDGTRAVLKIGVPYPELMTELAALRHFDGRGSVRLLAADEDAGAMLLERVEPGTPLFELADDATATSIAARVMRRLWRPAPVDHSYPTVARWGEGFKRLRVRFPDGGPFPRPLLEQAEALFSELLASSAPPVVLHGDLHHWNILRADRDRWLAIDPKGVVGEPAYEVGALLRNPLPYLLERPDPAGTTARRVVQLSEELGFDRERVRCWGLAQAVLSAWWCLEDGVDCFEFAIACAELLARIRP
jgi:streptomycin 6-kinase